MWGGGGAGIEGAHGAAAANSWLNSRPTAGCLDPRVKAHGIHANAHYVATLELRCCKWGGADVPSPRPYSRPHPQHVGGILKACLVEGLTQERGPAWDKRRQHTHPPRAAARRWPQQLQPPPPGCTNVPCSPGACRFGVSSWRRVPTTRRHAGGRLCEAAGGHVCAAAAVGGWPAGLDTLLQQDVDAAEDAAFAGDAGGSRCGLVPSRGVLVASWVARGRWWPLQCGASPANDTGVRSPARRCCFPAQAGHAHTRTAYSLYRVLML